jgi:hypothetical protein
MFFLSASDPDLVRSLQASLGSERILWTGRCAVAEYAFDEPASLPRWTLPEETLVAVTETRVAFAEPSGRAGGELHWLWPQHLRVQPGNRDTGRSATVTQIQLVCGGPAGSFPALVFAGGDLTTVGDADRLANVLRQSIARFRVEHSGELGLAAPQARMLSRLVIGPEFNNYQGGEGQTVSLLGSIVVEGPIRTGLTGPTLEVEPVLPSEQEPFLDEYPVPGRNAYEQPVYEYPAASEPVQAWPAQIPQLMPPPQLLPPPHPVLAPEPEYTDLASRAADLAARVASLVSANAGADQSLERFETQTTNLSAFLAQDGDNPTTNLSAFLSEGDLTTNLSAFSAPGYPGEGYPREGDDERAEAVRRTAARFARNSGRTRTTGQRPAGEEYGARPRNS